VNEVSQTVARIIGWEKPELELAPRWLVDGAKLKGLLAPFIAEQSERLDPSTLRLDSFAGDQVNFLIDGWASDHESSHLFKTTVRGSYNVLTGNTVRE
jgi:hypothetical protein